MKSSQVKPYKKKFEEIQIAYDEIKRDLEILKGDYERVLIERNYYKKNYEILIDSIDTFTNTSKKSNKVTKKKLDGVLKRMFFKIAETFRLTNEIKSSRI